MNTNEEQKATDNGALLISGFQQPVNMEFIDFTAIVKEAWQAYDDTRKIIRIVDISAKVSTNHVYRVTFEDKKLHYCKAVLLSDSLNILLKTIPSLM